MDTPWVLIYPVFDLLDVLSRSIIKIRSFWDFSPHHFVCDFVWNLSALGVDGVVVFYNKLGYGNYIVAFILKTFYYCAESIGSVFGIVVEKYN